MIWLNCSKDHFSNLPMDGTNQLPKDWFDWIALKVIFQGRKDLNSLLPPFWPYKKNLFLYLNMELPKDGTNELWRDGFDWITLKVIFKVRKVKFKSFYVLIEFIEVCSLLGVILVLFSNLIGHFKGNFKGQKGPIWTFVIFRIISQKWFMLWPVCMKYTYKVIYDLSVYLMTFDIGRPLNVTELSRGGIT